MNDVAATVIINDKGEILILKRSDKCDSGKGLWNFPGGSIEDEEGTAVAASRELNEETGLTANPDALLYVGSREFDNAKGRFIHFFITDEFSGEVNINYESSEFAWTSMKNLNDYLFVGGGIVPPKLVKSIKEFMEL